VTCPAHRDLGTAPDGDAVAVSRIALQLELPSLLTRLIHLEPRAVITAFPLFARELARNLKLSAAVITNLQLRAELPVTVIAPALEPPLAAGQCGSYRIETEEQDGGHTQQKPCA
jgi:hypothetical protein